MCAEKADFRTHPTKMEVIMIKQYLKNNWSLIARNLINRAELEIVGTKRGTERMSQCVAWLRPLLPWWIRWLVTDASIRWLIQSAFDAMQAALEPDIGE